MEPTDLMPLIEQLGENIDDLEEVMAPLLQNKLLETAGRLPLLDKAQLYVLATFAIESLIFCRGSRSMLSRNGLLTSQRICVSMKLTPKSTPSSASWRG